jgi:hypothetical protein
MPWAQDVRERRLQGVAYAVGTGCAGAAPTGCSVCRGHRMREILV